MGDKIDENVFAMIQDLIDAILSRDEAGVDALKLSIRTAL